MLLLRPLTSMVLHLKKFSPLNFKFLKAAWFKHRSIDTEWEQTAGHAEIAINRPTRETTTVYLNNGESVGLKKKKT